MSLTFEEIYILWDIGYVFDMKRRGFSFPEIEEDEKIEKQLEALNEHKRIMKIVGRR